MTIMSWCRKLVTYLFPNTEPFEYQLQNIVRRTRTRDLVEAGPSLVQIGEHEFLCDPLHGGPARPSRRIASATQQAGVTDVQDRTGITARLGTTRADHLVAQPVDAQV